MCIGCLIWARHLAVQTNTEPVATQPTPRGQPLPGPKARDELPNFYHCGPPANSYLERRNLISILWLMVYAHIQPSEHLRAFVREYMVGHFRFGPADPVPVKPFPAPPTRASPFTRAAF